MSTVHISTESEVVQSVSLSTNTPKFQSAILGAGQWGRGSFCCCCFVLFCCCCFSAAQVFLF